MMRNARNGEEVSEMDEQAEWDRVTELADFLHIITKRMEIITTDDGWLDKDVTIDKLEKGKENLEKFIEKLREKNATFSEVEK